MGLGEGWGNMSEFTRARGSLSCCKSSSTESLSDVESESRAPLGVLAAASWYPPERI